MDNTRTNKIERQIQKDLADIFQKNTNTICKGNMLTVSAVKITADLSLAKVYLSVFPTKEKEELIKHINEHAGQVRFELGKKIRHQVRIIPELRFYIDDSLDKIENIEKLLNE
ncbi:MAG: 30S ribosome-binding factor RbfA [Bacteroidota bacterium]|nr:30S ribosome-binding factor RbfA [Bacteroidota bacterium]